VLVFAGCGVVGTQFHPGLAAQVGDETITTRHVDQVTANYCTALEKVTKGNTTGGSQQTPMRYLAHDFTSALVEKAAAEQLAAEYGVEPTSEYKKTLAQLEPQMTALDDDEKAAVREVVGAQSYTNDVLTQIGEIELKKQGKTGATSDDQLAAGQARLKQWVADHGVEINPRYGAELGTGDQVDTDLSYPLGTEAKGGLDKTVDPGYTASLPHQLVCLDYS
jgi:peptidyl-prolyl cis-trans isomerase SurA